MQFVNLRTYRLEQSSNCYCFIHRHRYIAYPEFNGIKEWMNAKVPPYLFCIVYTICFNKQLHITVIRLYAFKGIWYTSTREFVKHFRAERLVTRKPPFPEW